MQYEVQSELPAHYLASMPVQRLIRLAYDVYTQPSIDTDMETALRAAIQARLVKRV